MKPVEHEVDGSGMGGEDRLAAVGGARDDAHFLGNARLERQAPGRGLGSGIARGCHEEDRLQVQRRARRESVNAVAVRGEGDCRADEAETGSEAGEVRPEACTDHGETRGIGARLGSEPGESGPQVGGRGCGIVRERFGSPVGRRRAPVTAKVDGERAVARSRERRGKGPPLAPAPAERMDEENPRGRRGRGGRKPLLGLQRDRLPLGDADNPSDRPFRAPRLRGGGRREIGGGREQSEGESEKDQDSSCGVTGGAGRAPSSLYRYLMVSLRMSKWGG